MNLRLTATAVARRKLLRNSKVLRRNHKPAIKPYSEPAESNSRKQICRGRSIIVYCAGNVTAMRNSSGQNHNGKTNTSGVQKFKTPNSRIPNHVIMTVCCIGPSDKDTQLLMPAAFNSVRSSVSMISEAERFLQERRQ
jgi:hypothetical protein